MFFRKNTSAERARDCQELPDPGRTESMRASSSVIGSAIVPPLPPNNIRVPSAVDVLRDTRSNIERANLFGLGCAEVGVVLPSLPEGGSGHDACDGRAQSVFHTRDQLTCPVVPHIPVRMAAYTKPDMKHGHRFITTHTPQSYSRCNNI